MPIVLSLGQKAFVDEDIQMLIQPCPGQIGTVHDVCWLSSTFGDCPEYSDVDLHEGSSFHIATTGALTYFLQ